MIILLVNEGWRGRSCSRTRLRMADLCLHGYLRARVDAGDWRSRGREGGRGADVRNRCSVQDYADALPATRFVYAGRKTDPDQSLGRELPTSRRNSSALRRMRNTSPKGRACPLCDRDITRQGCIDIIRAEGLDVPQKSGCWICPFQRAEQWRELWRRYPELYERAARLEELSTARRGGVVTMLDPSQRYTLRQRQVMFEQQTTMFDDDELDAMLIYKPCLCGV